jgi:hypothetical protein
VSEALAAGTPIILNRGTGADDMVSIGVDSLLFQDLRISDIKNELETRKLASNAAKSSLKNHPKAASEGLVKIYEDNLC